MNKYRLNEKNRIYIYGASYRGRNLYEKLMQNDIPVIVDDRKQGMLGAKIKDCYMFGTPYMLVLGNKAQEGSFEIESTKTGEKKTFTEDELIDEFVKMNNARKYVK